MQDLTPNAIQVLRSRYLRRDSEGKITETPRQLFERVAKAIAQAEVPFGGPQAMEAAREDFLRLLTNLDFLPNSPTLMNAGTPLGQLSACFVLPVPDDLAGIFDSLKIAVLVQQSGGGTGFSFSRLRPNGDLIQSTGGRASGPVSFMKIFDATTEYIRQGGKRRGANMGVLRCDHPDIMEFVQAKRDGKSLQNFNLSVGATDVFWTQVDANQHLPLRHPTTGQVVGSLSAPELLDEIVAGAWQTGDPGMLFLDTINRSNPTPHLGMIEATNPCGEVPLLPYEACNLGSINLPHFVREDAGRPAIDYDRLGQCVRTAVRFLDDVIEVSRFPADPIQQMVHGNRKIGLGVMGFAELLIRLGIPYASPGAVATADQLMEFISDQAIDMSRQLAAERGCFPNWQDSTYAASGDRRRNATCTSIAPTGTIGIIAGTSPSIEPLFALAYQRQHVLEDTTLFEVNPLLEPLLRARDLPAEMIMQHVVQHGTLEGCSAVDADTRELLRTALEIPPDQHLAVQAAFQRHVDNAVSKTVNLPETASKNDVKQVYRQAWELGLKGVTVYRYGSHAQQVMQLGAEESAWEREHFASCDPHACKV